MADTTQRSEEEVTDLDIKLFKTSLLARRFPGIKDLTDEDIKALLLQDRKATGRKLQAHLRTHPKTEFQPPPPKREGYPVLSPAPFAPINPSQAKDMVMRPHSECFTCLGSDYNLDRTDFLQDKHSDTNKKPPPAFMPSNPSQARETIKVDYYLNSLDARSKQEELTSTRQRGQTHLQGYQEQQTTRRGTTLVDCRSSIQRRHGLDD